eukprot:a352269_69.p2 GENE.a352269_69~~a352269_69.p2  ORF type:complete len:148 (-),score=39.46 a352269_69:405-821(-)
MAGSTPDARVTRVSGSELIRLLTGDKRTQVLVVDVRDDDFEGGNIKGAHHFPSESFEADNVADFVVASAKKLGGERLLVVFHCMYSQQRGPSMAELVRAELAERGASENLELSVLSGGFVSFSRFATKHPEVFENLER